MLSSVVAMMASAFLAADSGPAVAAPTAAPAAAVSKHDKNKMVCKNSAPTGTRLGSRVCRTQEEWDDITAEHQKLIRDQMSHQNNRQG